MTTLHEADRQALMANPWFAALPEAFRLELLACAQWRALEAGALVYARGDAGTAWLAVVEGVVRISGTSSAGREAVLTFYTPGHWFGEISLLDGLRRTHDASAHTAARLLAVPGADFRRLLRAHPDFSLALLQLCATRLRAVAAGLESSALDPPEQRLASRLLALAHGYGNATPGGLCIQLHLPQETLAQLIGVSRQRVHQVLKAWEAQALIAQHYGRIEILDLQRLASLADGTV